MKVTPGTLRILVVDDFAPWRDFVSSLLKENPAWRAVIQASDGLEAVQKAQELTPDLILLGVGLPKLNGLEAARRIREVAPNSKILFVSAHPESDFVEAALAAGACGYVFKSNAGRELRQAAEAALQGKRFVSRKFKQDVSDEAPEMRAPADFAGGDDPA